MLQHVPREMLDIAVDSIAPAGPAGEFTRERITLRDWLGIRDRYCYGMEVAGCSMTGAGIYPGDYIIADTSRDVYDGCVVVADVPGEGTTLKRYFGGALYSDSVEEESDLVSVRDHSRVCLVVGHVRGERALRKRWDQWEREKREATIRRLLDDGNS